MNKLPNHTALKEWSNVVEALGAGTQTVLVRKGGIADATFGVEAARFYLYPTYFHQGELEARPSVSITHWCEVVRTWTVSSPDALDRLEPCVALPRSTLDARFQFRPDQALFVIGVRTWRLPQTVTVAFHEVYGGCRSWISLDDEIDVDRSEQVLSEPELQAQLNAVDRLV